ncbi:glycosyltransferase family 1 protein [Altererythrobacter fulvus]|uniref:glycosyltransferase family 4 protein n=1 Tax=Caenibius fulvus TaxID=2126012 RepID=UPI003019AAF4
MPLVCIDCRYVGARPSGIGELVQALVDHVPTLAPELDFLLLRNPLAPGPLSAAANVREVVVRQAANGPATMWWLPHAVNLARVDLFHATFNIMPAGLSMPCITTVHDVMRLTNPAWCGAGPLEPLERIFYAHGIRRALRGSAAIATVSEASRAAIAAYAPAAGERTHVTFPGVAEAFHPVEPDRLRLAALGADPARRFVLTVGQYAPYKNHEGALRAFALALGGKPEFDLILVQRMGRDGRRLLELARDLGVGGRVRLLPAIARDDLVQLYSAADVLLHPSFCEGFGMPPAEAMACGCPVVTSDLSSMPEVAGGAALLADPHDPAALADALRRVVEHPALAATMRRRGLARAAALSWRAFAEANVALYRAVISAGVRSSSRAI